MIKEIIDFIKDPSNFHLLLLILPPLTFYLNNKWIFFIVSIVCLSILLAYRLDLLNKKKEVVDNRIKSLKKKKIKIKDFKKQIKNADNEFKNYLLSWPFFGLVSIIFIGLYIYSTIISFNYSLILFGIHLGLAVFMLILYLIIDKNLKILATRKKIE